MTNSPEQDKTAIPPVEGGHPTHYLAGEHPDWRP